MFFLLYVLFYLICFIFVLYILFLSSVLRCKRISKQRDAGSESTHVVTSVKGATMLSQMYIKSVTGFQRTCMYKIYIHTNIIYIMYKNEDIRLDCLAKTQDMTWGKTGCNQVKSLAGHFSIMLKKIQQKTIWPVRSSWRSWGFFWHTKCYLAQILKKQTSFTVSWESIRAFDLFHTLCCDCNITGYICCQFWSELNSEDMFLTFLTT